MKYHINKIKKGDFDEIIRQVKDALSDEGFGVLSEINIRDKMKEKPGVDFGKYTILGACNPAFAYRALLSEDKIGTMLPCNVVVRQSTDDTVEVAAVDPVVSMAMVENENVSAVAREIRAKLICAIGAL